jgi:hypothetical protein
MSFNVSASVPHFDVQPSQAKRMRRPLAFVTRTIRNEALLLDPRLQRFWLE